MVKMTTTPTTKNVNEPQVLELKPFPSIAAKLSILGSMLVSLLAPLAVDRLCVKLFDPELHKARKAGPPLGMVVRNRSLKSRHRMDLHDVERLLRIVTMCLTKPFLCFPV